MEYLLLCSHTKSNDVGKKEVVDIIRKELGDEAEEIMPSLAQRWIEEGEEKGFKKGIVKEKIDVCKNALNSGISPEVVSKITGLSLKKVLEIKKELQ